MIASRHMGTLLGLCYIAWTYLETKLGRGFAKVRLILGVKVGMD